MFLFYTSDKASTTQRAGGNIVSIVFIADFENKIFLKSVSCEPLQNFLKYNTYFLIQDTYSYHTKFVLDGYASMSAGPSLLIRNMLENCGVVTLIQEKM